MAVQKEYTFAYTTLITRASYLAGVLVLAHTLKKQGSRYPLVVLYSSLLDKAAISALEDEAPKSNLILRECTILYPPKRAVLVAKRWEDTWTKLRVFELFEYETVCYLDADMALFKNMDSVFSRVDLGSDQIAACHDCICNPDKLEWAPDDWRPENCAFTAVSHPEALVQPIQPSPDSRPTYHTLNSGMFLYHPSIKLWHDMLDFFNTTDKFKDFRCPDQDFLAEFFRNRWISLPWQYNAQKTLRYQHTNLWIDEEVVCLHYIVDKPWAARMRDDGSAGYKGLDGATHQRWWNEYSHWEAQRQSQGACKVLETVRRHMASEGGECSSDDDLKVIGSEVQSPASSGSE